MSKLGQLSKSVGVAGCLVTLSDLTQPIAPFATYIAAISLVVLVLLGLVKLFSKNWGETHTIFSYFICIILVLSSVLTFYQHGSKNAKKSGLIASKVPTVKDIQASLGMVNAQLKEINTSLHSIDDKMDNAKKEVSKNPRKELANLGIPWDSERFFEAISHNDQPIIDLFFQGGMQVDRIADSYNGNAILTHLIYEPKNNGFNIIKQAKSHGFNFDTKIRHNYGSTLSSPVFLAFKQEQYEIAEYILKQGVDTSQAFSVFAKSLKSAQSTIKRGKPSVCVRAKDDHFNTLYGSCVQRYRNKVKAFKDANSNVKKAKKVLDLIKRYS
jgi:hypothetical protein